MLDIAFDIERQLLKNIKNPLLRRFLSYIMAAASIVIFVIIVLGGGIFALGSLVQIGVAILSNVGIIELIKTFLINFFIIIIYIAILMLMFDDRSF